MGPQGFRGSLPRASTTTGDRPPQLRAIPVALRQVGRERTVGVTESLFGLLLPQGIHQSHRALTEVPIELPARLKSTIIVAIEPRSNMPSNA
jgi:hypothetical protein